MNRLKYLTGYSKDLIKQVEKLIAAEKVGDVITRKYPEAHTLGNDKALYEYAISIKNEYLRKSQPLSKVVYDTKITMANQALGLHTYAKRIQGKKIKAKNEIRISSTFKKVPLAFLRMILVHELAHLKEKDHNKAFYKLCEYMEPNYHQIEFDLRLYLTHVDLFGKIY